MTLTSELRKLLARLKLQSPAGFAAAFHVVFITPKYLFQTYPKAWADLYSRTGLQMKDPAVKWGFGNNGIATWDELQAIDTDNVFPMAAEYGMKHWTIVATMDQGSKSIGAFSRNEPGFSPEDQEQIFADFMALHHLTLKGPETEPGFGDMLHDLSIDLTHSVSK